jgi:hypothetical protein
MYYGSTDNLRFFLNLKTDEKMLNNRIIVYKESWRKNGQRRLALYLEKVYVKYI